MAASPQAIHNATLLIALRLTLHQNTYHYTTTVLALKAAQGPWACTSASPAAVNTKAKPGGGTGRGTGRGVGTGGGARQATLKE